MNYGTGTLAHLARAEHTGEMTHAVTAVASALSDIADELARVATALETAHDTRKGSPE